MRPVDGYLLTPMRQYGLISHLRLSAQAFGGGLASLRKATLVVHLVRGKNLKPTYALVKVHGHAAVVQGTLNAFEFAYVARFVQRNRAALLAHWQGNLDSFDFIFAVRLFHHRRFRSLKQLRKPASLPCERISWKPNR